jgi:hypothetical protein
MISSFDRDNNYCYVLCHSKNSRLRNYAILSSGRTYYYSRRSLPFSAINSTAIHKGVKLIFTLNRWLTLPRTVVGRPFVNLLSDRANRVSRLHPLFNHVRVRLATDSFHTFENLLHPKVGSLMYNVYLSVPSPAMAGWLFALLNNVDATKTRDPDRKENKTNNS